MQLYFAPLACSMASRIALLAAGAEARFTEVDTRAGRVVEDGADFRALNPLGQVPVLRTDDGALLTENAAILQHIAARHAAAGLDGGDPDRLRQWLSFIGTELHKAVFTPLLDRAAPEGAKAYARDKAVPRLTGVEAAVQDRDWLLERFSVADAYLVTVLNWAQYGGISLAAWPGVQAWCERARQHPPVARAFAEETALYAAARARKAA